MKIKMTSKEIITGKIRIIKVPENEFSDCDCSAAIWLLLTTPNAPHSITLNYMYPVLSEVKYELVED